MSNAANISEFKELSYFLLIFVKTKEFFRVVPWVKLKAEVSQIFCYLFYIAKNSHYGGRRDLSFTYIKFDIILMGLKILTSCNWEHHVIGNIM